MALDEATIRARFAAMLRDWRTQRGHGNPKRFPQQAAMEELRELTPVSFRTYQGWESGLTMPRRWSTVELICAHIGRNPTELIQDDEEPGEPGAGGDDSMVKPVEALERRVAGVEVLLGQTVQQLEQISRQLEHISRQLLAPAHQDDPPAGQDERESRPPSRISGRSRRRSQ